MSSTPDASFTLDLDAYLRRIAYVGSREPTLATLNGIVGRHTHAIPFENLDVLLDRDVSLRLQDIERKLVFEGRGGYCFEQNTLLLHALEALGFAVTPLSARVRIRRPREFVPPRTHLFLRVELAGASFLADVGVGGLSPTSALSLTVGVEQTTPHEPRRLVPEGEWSAGLGLRSPDARLLHQAHFVGDWHDVYEFTLEPMPEIDREVGNWFTSKHPASHFRGQLLVALATESGRTTLLNNELSHRNKDGTATVRRLTSCEELVAVLALEFGLRIEPSARLTSVWPSLASAG